MKGKAKTEKGITLIALIITIVVLLILAAVAISSITNDGILSYATNAAKEYNQAVANEQSILKNYMEQLNTIGTNNGAGESDTSSDNEELVLGDQSLEEQAISCDTVTEWTSGEGTEASPYIISSKENLAYLAKQVNSGNRYTGVYFKLSGNIDMESNNDSWIPIGNNSAMYFDGTLYGNACNITGLSNVTAPYNYRGLFGFTGKNSKIVDLTIEGLSLGNSTATKNGDFTGGIVGYNRGIIQNCHITNAELNGENYVGAISGYNSGSVIDCSANNINIVANSYAGGITGYSSNKLADIICANGFIDCNNYVGGIVGYNKGQIISYTIENLNVADAVGQNDGSM